MSTPVEKLTAALAEAKTVISALNAEKKALKAQFKKELKTEKPVKKTAKTAAAKKTTPAIKKMKLYYKRGACSLTIRILAHELNIPCEYESVDLQTKQTESGVDYFTINSKGSVPAVTFNNKEVLTENPVILQYLADTYHATQLLPAVGNMKRYRVLEALNFCCTDMHGGCGPFFNPKIPSELKQEVFLPNLKRKVAIVEKQLAAHTYLAGDKFTLADIYLFVVLSWFPHIGIELAEWPNIVKYIATIKNRKAVREALQEEGLN